jgi:hypothetical protein
MSELTPKQIDARIEEIERELEKLEKEKAAEEPVELDEQLRLVEIAHEQLKTSLEALQFETERLSRLAKTA